MIRVSRGFYIGRRRNSDAGIASNLFRPDSLLPIALMGPRLAVHARRRDRDGDTGTLNGAPSDVRRRGAGPTVRNGPIRRSERREREGGATVNVRPVLMRLPRGRRQDNRNDLPLRKTLKRSFPRPCVDRDAPYRRSKLDLEPIHPSGMVTPFGWIGSESSSERRVALMRLPWGPAV